MRCISALPGESASNDRVVKTPYVKAAPAQTSATTTPWSVKKSLKFEVLQRNDWMRVTALLRRADA
jgi:hypothetical protein